MRYGVLSSRPFINKILNTYVETVLKPNCILSDKDTQFGAWNGVTLQRRQKSDVNSFLYIFEKETKLSDITRKWDGWFGHILIINIRVGQTWWNLSNGVSILLLMRVRVYRPEYLQFEIDSNHKIK